MAKETLATVKITFKAFKKIMKVWNNMADQDETLLKTKFGYAMKRFFDKNIDIVFKDYNQKLTSIRIDHALVDEKTKALLTKEVKTPGGREFEYGKEELKAVIAAEQKLEAEWEKKEFDIYPYICKDVPELDEVQLEVFKGFVV